MKKMKTLLLATIAGLCFGMSVNAIPNYPTYTAKVYWMGHGAFTVSGYGYYECMYAVNVFKNTHKPAFLIQPGCIPTLDS